MEVRIIWKSGITILYRYISSKVIFSSVSDMLISYYANKKSFPRLPSWQPGLIFFNKPIESGSTVKPCTLKHFQVTYMLHKAGYWTTRWWRRNTPGHQKPSHLISGFFFFLSVTYHNYMRPLCIGKWWVTKMCFRFPKENIKRTVQSDKSKLKKTDFFFSSQNVVKSIKAVFTTSSMWW